MGAGSQLGPPPPYESVVMSDAVSRALPSCPVVFLTSCIVCAGDIDASAMLLRHAGCLERARGSRRGKCLPMLAELAICIARHPSHRPGTQP